MEWWDRIVKHVSSKENGACAEESDDEKKLNGSPSASLILADVDRALAQSSVRRARVERKAAALSQPPPPPVPAKA